ncbi:hypothetical protein [Parapedobacter sp. 2B3]|uniref:hypothetical protein n=1 Tax=Parapedobacter sp. 2B3 TaxID=3342381 RepID=UPI0035B5D631
MKRMIIARPLKAVMGGLLIAAIALHGCREDKYSLGNIPTPDFEVQTGQDANTLVFVNKTPGSSIAYWETSTGQKFKGDNVSARFTFEGQYDVTLTAVTAGGIATTTKQVSIAQSDPTACNPDRALGFIAGCTEKVWMLNPGAGAYKVGPNPDDGSWWQNTAGDVTSRACEFNDEYTFVFDAAGTFNYDNKGDFYADGYLGAASSGCEPNSNLPAAQQKWASGAFAFSVDETGGVRNLGKLTVSGVGAHIGLQKVHNAGETTTGPTWNSVTYDILEMTQNAGGQGYDILKVGVDIGGGTWWTFTLRAAI